MKKIIVVKNPQKFQLDIKNIDIISSKDYLQNPEFGKMKNVRVFNLSDDYSYQTRGYYVSLLAEARGHKVIPHVRNIIDIENTSTLKAITKDMDTLIQNSLRKIKSKDFILSIYFGKNIAVQHLKLSQELYRLFQTPMLRAKFTYHKKWILQNIHPIAMKDIPEEHMSFVRKFAEDYFLKKRYDGERKDSSIYDLAILVNPDDIAPPSNKKAITKFVDIAEDLGFMTEVIGPKDFSRIPAFDALFIREDTKVSHHTYRFARRAQNLGLAVIDTPEAILRCNNKVYLAEVLQGAKIPTPKTLIIQNDNKELIEDMIGFPCVLKLPDSSSSIGVYKVENISEMEIALRDLFKISDLVIAQEFTFTNFDWRIGILDGKVVFACKYYMAKDHWQIFNWKSKSKKYREGDFECIAFKDVPELIFETALKAANLIGHGLYGVDLKEIKGKVFVIEINECPNIDFGIEDSILKDELYKAVILALKKRIEEKIGIANGR